MVHILGREVYFVIYFWKLGFIFGSLLLVLGCLSHINTDENLFVRASGIIGSDQTIPSASVALSVIE